MPSKCAYSSSHYSIFIFHLPVTVPPFKLAERLLFAKDYLYEKMGKSFAAAVLSGFDLFSGRKTSQFSTTLVIRFFKTDFHGKIYNFLCSFTFFQNKTSDQESCYTAYLTQDPCDPISYNLFSLHLTSFTSTYSISSLFRKLYLPQGILLDT